MPAQKSVCPNLKIPAAQRQVGFIANPRQIYLKSDKSANFLFYPLMLSRHAQLTAANHLKFEKSAYYPFPPVRGEMLCFSTGCMKTRQITGYYLFYPVMWKTDNTYLTWGPTCWAPCLYYMPREEGQFPKHCNGVLFK